MIREFLGYLREKGYSPKTVQAYRSVFRYFKDQPITEQTLKSFQEKTLSFKPQTRFAYAIRLKRYLNWLKSDLQKGVIIPKTPQNLPQDIPSQNQIKDTLQKPKVYMFKGVRDRAILEVLYSTGIRKGELLNLSVSDIDRGKHLIRIHQGKTKRDRMVPISKKAVQWLNKYLDQVRPMLKGKTTHVFLSMRGRKLCENGVHKIVKSYGKASTHKYRHSFATHLLQNGMKVTSVQKLLGHSQLTSTQVYTHVTIEDLKTSYKKYHKRDLWR